MKNIFWITLMLPLVTYAQVSDDFETGSVSRWIFSPPGEWAADITSSISGVYSLHHIYDNPEAGISMAGLDISSLRSDLGDITWKFKVRHGCDPSSSNNWGVYLVSDSEPSLMAPGESSSGFVAGVNLSGYDDTLRIWRSESGDLTPVVNTKVNWQTDIGISDYASFFIVRSIEGEWSISVGVGDSDPVVVGEGFDRDWFFNKYFGFYFRYTSTRDRLFWFDDLLITGVFVEDILAPEITSSSFSSSSTILLDLSEPILSQLISPDNFIVTDNHVSPLSVYSTGNKIILKFPEFFENKRVYKLSIINLCDLNGNCRSTVEIPIILAYPEWGDVVISEFMADPDPPVNLPGCEYVELYNASGFDFDLTGMSLDIGTRDIQLPAANLVAYGYILVCNEYCDWTDFEAIEIIKHQDFPSISNNGTLMILTDTTGEPIHGLEFNTSWFNDVLKSDGGWSMEMIDTDYPFQSGENWRFSTNRDGGTPGFINSVASFNPDTESPWIDNIYPESDSIVIVVFSEPVDIKSTSAKSWGNDFEVVEIKEASLLRSSYRLYLDEKLLFGSIYKMTVPDLVTDFSKNSLVRSSLGFGLPESPAWNDLVINEILFDALPGESEFIEIYNSSGHIFNASGLFMVSVNSQTGDTGKPVWLSEAPRCIMPGDYYAITNGKESIINVYTSYGLYYVFETGSIPSLQDDEGIILLFTREHDLIDRVAYSEKMHFDLLSVTEGVTLERIDASASSDNPFNWHSASGVSGWGTPGIINSMVIESVDGGAIHLSSRKISPDNDGFEDVLQITVNVPDIGSVITSIIYNDMGMKVCTLLNPTVAGGENKLYWDGTSDSGSLLPRGIYIIFIEVTGSRGERSVYRRVCAIVR